MNQLVSHSFGLGGMVTDLFKELKPKSTVIDLTGGQSGTGQNERIADCNQWLPYAAKEFNLSKDIRDYVLVPIPAMFTGLPNTNGDSVSLQQMLKFNTTRGCQAYKTFKGMPTFVEHANKDHTVAKGVILDSFLRPLQRFGDGRHYKLSLLLAYDRTRDPLLVNSILSGENNAYSIGFYFKAYTCSICGNRMGLEGGSTCSHTMPRQPTYKQPDGRLVYRKCEDINGFECSSVANPAFVTAIGPYLMDPRSMP